MKTDSIFYRLFKELPDSFFEMIGQPASEASAYRFESVEVKDTAYRIDGFFVPRVKNYRRPLYFGEVQFYRSLNIYSSTFAEIFTYLDRTDPAQDWRAVFIFKDRSTEPNKLIPYQELLNSPKVTRVYLDELEVGTANSLGLRIIKLVVTPEAEAPARARELLEQVPQEVADDQQAQNVVDLIETIVLYKFPNLSREELEAMLGLDDLRQTKFAREMRQEGKQEARLESVPRLLALGLTVEQVAQGLGLTVEQVQQAAQTAEQSEQ